MSYTITPEHAEALLADDAVIHSTTGSIGADWSRESVLALIRTTTETVIAGEGSLMRAMRHPLAVMRPNGRFIFFEVDQDKFDAFEASRVEAAA
jgi:hypothetical protein